VLAEPVVQAGDHAVVEPARVRQERREQQREGDREGGHEPAPAVPARHGQGAQELPAPGRDHEREQEERARHEQGDERRLLGGEREREDDADERRVVLAGTVDPAPDHHDQRERDGGEVDVLAGEAAEVEIARAEGEEHRRGERAEAAEVAAQAPAQRDHRRAHERGGQAGGEVRVAEGDVHQRRQVEAQRAVQQRVVLVVARLAEQVREVGVLALVVVERALAEGDEAHEQGEREDPGPDPELPLVLGGEPLGGSATARPGGGPLGGDRLLGGDLGHGVFWLRASARAARRFFNPP
jgi:hypothetical protein